jgi:hypothetical protein
MDVLQAARGIIAQRGMQADLGLRRTPDPSK